MLGLLGTQWHRRHDVCACRTQHWPRLSARRLDHPYQSLVRYLRPRVSIDINYDLFEDLCFSGFSLGAQFGEPTRVVMGGGRGGATVGLLMAGSGADDMLSAAIGVVMGDGVSGVGEGGVDRAIEPTGGAR